jgi:hypothetical protein
MMSDRVPRRLAPDRLLVPMRAESDDGVIGDGAVEIGPDHPQYESWAAYLERYRDDQPTD